MPFAHAPPVTIWLRCIAASYALSLACAPVGAGILEGQTFNNSVRVFNHDLRLNGLGVRAIFFIKGYVAGLYLSEKVASIKDVIAMPGPKRLQLRMLRKAGPDDFNSALVDGIRKNASEFEMAGLSSRVAQLEQTILSIGNSKEGDVIDFDYVPEYGTTLAINGTIKGSAIAGVDFYIAVLGIFVGEHPIDSRLKKGLLGK